MKLEVPFNRVVHWNWNCALPVDGGLWDDLLLEENITLLFDIEL